MSADFKKYDNAIAFRKALERENIGENIGDVASFRN